MCRPGFRHSEESRKLQSEIEKAWWAARPKQDPEERRRKCNVRKQRERKARIARDPEREKLKAHERYMRLAEKGYYQKWVEEHPQSTREAFQKWKSAHLEEIKEYKRAWSLRERYSMSVEEYEKLLGVQQSRCAICARDERAVDPRTTALRKLSVDHDHVTGKVRGLLCGSCNRALGLFGDDPEVLAAAETYVRKCRAV